MHELSIMQNTLEAVCASAREAGAEKVTQIRLRIGAMSGVVRESLEFAFEALAPDTMAAGAALLIEEVPPLCFCEGCQKEFTPEAFVFACPACGRPASELRRGREIELVSIEVPDHV